MLLVSKLWRSLNFCGLTHASQSTLSLLLRGEKYVKVLPPKRKILLSIVTTRWTNLALGIVPFTSNRLHFLTTQRWVVVAWHLGRLETIPRSLRKVQLPEVCWKSRRESEWTISASHTTKNIRAIADYTHAVTWSRWGALPFSFRLPKAPRLDI